MNNELMYKILQEESGIIPEVIVEAQVKHIEATKAYEVVGLSKSGIAFPYFNTEGKYEMSRLRKDIVEEGEGRYHHPAGKKCLPYFVKSNLDAILDPSKPLIILEGEKSYFLFTHILTISLVEWFQALVVMRSHPKMTKENLN